MFRPTRGGIYKSRSCRIVAGPRHSRGSRHFTAPHWRRRGRRKGKGVSVGDYLIGHGSLTADTLYRCVAQHLGVPFLSRKLPLRDHIDPHTAARQGFAPLVPQHAGGARAVVASRSRTRTADQPRVAKRLSSSTCLPRSNGWTIRAPSSIRRSSSKRTICRRSPRSRRCAAAFLSRSWWPCRRATYEAARAECHASVR